MKRIYGVDLLRGIWTLILLSLHTYANYDAQLLDIGAATSGNFLASIIKFIARFPGVYYMISGVANAYVFYNKRKENKASGMDLFKQSVIMGLGLAVIGKIIGFLFGRSSEGLGGATLEAGATNYSIFGSFVETGIFHMPTISHTVYFMGALQVIGLSLAIYGSLLALLFNKSGYKKHLRNIAVLTGLVIIIMFVTTAFRNPLRDLWVRLILEEKVGSALFLGFLIVDTHPLLPFLSYGILGCIFGIAYATRFPYKKLCLFGCIFAFVNITTGAILYLILGEPPVEFILQTLTPRTMFMQIGIMTLIMMWVYSAEMCTGDLNPPKYFVKNKFFTRLNEGSLTIYSFEGFLAILIKCLILDKIFPGWAENLIFVTIYGAFLILLWFILLTVWKKVHYKGSVEWLLGKLKPKPSIQKEIVVEPIIIEEPIV